MYTYVTARKLAKISMIWWVKEFLRLFFCWDLHSSEILGSWSPPDNGGPKYLGGPEIFGGTLDTLTYHVDVRSLDGSIAQKRKQIDASHSYCMTTTINKNFLTMTVAFSRQKFEEPFKNNVINWLMEGKYRIINWKNILMIDKALKMVFWGVLFLNDPWSTSQRSICFWYLGFHCIRLRNVYDWWQLLVGCFHSLLSPSPISD